MSLELSRFLWDFRIRKTRSERIHSLQASQNQLAEPFKYSNTRHTSSTIVCCIPRMTASNERKRAPWTGAEIVSGFRLRTPVPAKRVMVQFEFRMLACGNSNCTTTAKRLNLLKRFTASTLEIFHSEHIPRGFARLVGNREGGEDEWVGQVLHVLHSWLRFSFFW